ncbi:transcription antitermination protein NusG [Aminobacter sp. MSH1]|uniref:transcription termination/antitermination protein NusG n=1 Tax=Aminobacter sp. MSH1 TaxID=374606 RepID=UPI000D375C6B|nr:transcription termination/antitermination NusG family protein [Aminobacter sp. MSH1]AWC21396.1 transcription antitermination protein NusG [Aminobacter sp. MSH1]
MKHATDTIRWYVVRARPSLELKAAEEIAGLGQVVYVPRFRKEYKHARHKRWSVKYFSLLTGYLFVLASDHWPRVLDCESVDCILRSNNGEPVPIPDATVQAIRAKQETGEYDEMRVHGRMEAGSSVKVISGALAGLHGPVSASTDEHVIMMLQMFGREVAVKAPLVILGQAG